MLGNPDPQGSTNILLIQSCCYIPTPLIYTISCVPEPPAQGGLSKHKSEVDSTLDLRFNLSSSSLHIISLFCFPGISNNFSNYLSNVRFQNLFFLKNCLVIKALLFNFLSVLFTFHSL